VPYRWAKAPPRSMSVTSRQRAGMARHAHVDDVAGVQVDLGGRARAFDHHHVVLGAQLVQRSGDLRPHGLAAAAPGQRVSSRSPAPAAPPGCACRPRA
jgi:hypothetical protein